MKIRSVRLELFHASRRTKQPQRALRCAATAHRSKKLSDVRVRQISFSMEWFLSKKATHGMKQIYTAPNSYTSWKASWGWVPLRARFWHSLTHAEAKQHSPRQVAARILFQVPAESWFKLSNTLTVKPIISAS